jgi:hypothetical protein
VILFLFLAWAHLNASPLEAVMNQAAIRRELPTPPLLAPPRPSLPEQFPVVSVTSSVRIESHQDPSLTPIIPQQRSLVARPMNSSSDITASKDNPPSASRTLPNSKAPKATLAPPDASLGPTLPNNSPPKKKAWFSED